MSVVIDKADSVDELANNISLPSGTVPVVCFATVVSFCSVNGKTDSKKEITGTHIVFDPDEVDEFKGFDFTAAEGQAMASFGVYAEPMPE